MSIPVASRGFLLSLIARRSRPVSGGICCLCQIVQEGKECRRLTYEQPVGCQGLDRTHCSPVGLCGANDRTDWELSVKEDGWLGHDQVGLEVLPSKWSRIEGRKDQPISGVGQRRRVACLVLPGLEVLCFGWPDAEQDTQHFRMGDPLSQRWVEAGPPLLDKRKVESSRVGDRLEMIFGGQVAIVSGNRRELPRTQTGDCLSESVTEVGILRAAAVPRPPTGVHRELHEVGEPSDLLGACRLTAWQGAKPI